MTKIALIGTAGRNPAKPMTKELWKAMLNDAQKRVQPEDDLISGGAAWADHLAVALYLMDKVQSLTLYLPAPLIGTTLLGVVKMHYEGRVSISAGYISNVYHQKFSNVLGIDSWLEIREAVEKGASVFSEPRSDNSSPFFVRNAKVAKAAEECLAYTWGPPRGGPADGGTKNTWDQIKGKRTNVSLQDLL